MSLQVFADYEKLLHSENYVTKRQSLKVWFWLTSLFAIIDAGLLQFSVTPSQIGDFILPLKVPITRVSLCIQSQLICMKTLTKTTVPPCLVRSDMLLIHLIPPPPQSPPPQLLGELLLDRHNFTVMTRYISKPENLKLMMNLLRDKSPNIQFEAFHVFKVNKKDKLCPIINTGNTVIEIRYWFLSCEWVKLFFFPAPAVRFL